MPRNDGNDAETAASKWSSDSSQGTDDGSRFFRRRRAVHSRTMCRPDMMGTSRADGKIRSSVGQRTVDIARRSLTRRPTVATGHPTRTRSNHFTPNFPTRRFRLDSIRAIRLATRRSPHRSPGPSGPAIASHPRTRDLNSTYVSSHFPSAIPRASSVSWHYPGVADVLLRRDSRSV